MPNLGEYLTGTDPRDGSDRVEISGAVREDRFVLTVPKAAGVDGARCAVEYSPDLQSWSGSGVTVLEDSSARLVASIPLGSSKGFLRPVFSLE